MNKQMKIKRILILILGLALCHNVHGQIQPDNSCFSNIYIDRPMLQADYESISSDSIPKKTLLGEWKVEIENQKIKSTTWIPYTDSLFYTKKILLRPTGLLSVDEKRL